jgi:Carboxypeptidase regulatory-like domain
MKATSRRKRARVLLLVPIFGAIFWVTALIASTTPGLLVLGVNVHGIGLASYAGDPGGGLAPLSSKILNDVSQDTIRQVGSASSNATPRPTVVAPATTPSSNPNPTPTPLPVPTVVPLPSLPPVPSVTPSPTPAPTATATPSRATINGQVVDTATHVGIAGAQVAITSGSSAATDANGNFTFGVNAGSYTLVATATGYNSASQTVTVSGGQNLAVTIKLTSVAATGGIKGDVTSATTTAALVGALIALSNGMVTVTDLSGAYTLPLVPYGNYTITASAGGHATQSQAVTVKPAHTTVVNFALAP